MNFKSFFKNARQSSLGHWFFCLLLGAVVLVGTVWLCLALWLHRPLGEFLSFVAVSVVALNALILLAFFGARLGYKRFLVSYVGLLVLGLGWFLSLTPTDNRAWQPEVSQVFNFSQVGNQITVNHIRNFAWQSEQKYQENWETRTYDLNQLTRADLLISDWGLNDIVHTMVSFGFDDGQYITFSIEIRKEQSEQYSSLAGFFRKYELLFVMGDEKDLIYTRSNVRGEQVYLYPIIADKESLQKLFLNYLKVGQSLKTNPKWYNTLFSNCTTVIYQLIDDVAPNALPKDYRILLAGRLPSYLYENRLISQQYSPAEWKSIAHINPKTKKATFNTPSNEFSQMIRK